MPEAAAARAEAAERADELDARAGPLGGVVRGARGGPGGGRGGRDGPGGGAPAGAAAERRWPSATPSWRAPSSAWPRSGRSSRTRGRPRRSSSAGPASSSAPSTPSAAWPRRRGRTSTTPGRRAPPRRRGRASSRWPAPHWTSSSSGSGRRARRCRWRSTPSASAPPERSPPARRPSRTPRGWRPSSPARATLRCWRGPSSRTSARCAGAPRPSSPRVVPRPSTRGARCRTGSPRSTGAPRASRTSCASSARRASRPRRPPPGRPRRRRLPAAWSPTSTPRPRPCASAPSRLPGVGASDPGGGPVAGRARRTGRAAGRGCGDRTAGVPTPRPIEVPAGAPPRGAVTGGAREYPWLRGALVKLAHDDPATAGRLLVALLPAQGAYLSEPLDYDLTITGTGTFAVSVTGARTYVTPRSAPRGRREADFHLCADPLTLAELLAGVGPRVRRLTGPARLRGRRRRLAALERIPAAAGSLADAARAGARLEPGLVFGALPYAIHPAWTRGHRFTVAQEIAGDATQTRYVVVADGTVTAAAQAPPEGVDATVTLTPKGFEHLLRGEPPPPGHRPVVRGDRPAVAQLKAWTDRAQAASPGTASDSAAQASGVGRTAPPVVSRAFGGRLGPRSGAVDLLSQGTLSGAASGRCSSRRAQTLLSCACQAVLRSRSRPRWSRKRLFLSWCLATLGVVALPASAGAFRVEPGDPYTGERVTFVAPDHIAGSSTSGRTARRPERRRGRSGRARATRSSATVRRWCRPSPAWARVRGL